MIEARVRVFLPTYRRPRLLHRALQSLLAQTYEAWTCELHNDAPDDASPEAVLTELAPNDPRIRYVRHEANWGAVAMFNHVFRGGPEPLACLLEDDNWWDPEFLAEMVKAAEANPSASIVWCNMRIWREHADGTWEDTDTAIWPNIAPDHLPAKFTPPELLQAFDALHSNGAMVFRSDLFSNATVPANTPFAIIECLRERSARGSLVLLPRPLAHFAMTRASTRSSDPVDWVHAKLLVAASFFVSYRVGPELLPAIWAARRRQSPTDTDIFFLLAMVTQQWRLLADARVSDWIHFLLATSRHPVRFVRTLSFRRAHPAVWNWLLNNAELPGSPARLTLAAKYELQ